VVGTWHRDAHGFIAALVADDQQRENAKEKIHLPLSLVLASVDFLAANSAARVGETCSGGRAAGRKEQPETAARDVYGAWEWLPLRTTATLWRSESQ
jgi:hypothetical protein